MPSFDVVCSFNVQEIDNAVNMVKRDINNRYDFCGHAYRAPCNEAPCRQTAAAQSHDGLQADHDCRRGASRGDGRKPG